MNCLHLEIKRFVTVENQNKTSQLIAQRLHGFRFTSSSGTYKLQCILIETNNANDGFNKLKLNARQG